MSLSTQPTAFQTLSHVPITMWGHLSSLCKEGSTVKGKGGDKEREVTTVSAASKPGLSPRTALLPLPLN